MARSDIKRGPGAVIFNTSTTIFSKADIEASIELQTSPTPSSVHGNIGDVVLDAMAKVVVPPLGEWEALAVLFPYASMAPGTSLFGDTDKPLKVWGVDGVSLLFAAAAITKMASIRCTPSETLLSPIEFTCLRPDAAAWATANSLYTVTTEAFASYAAFSKAAVLRVAFAAAWGSSPWDAIRTADGWTIDFDLKTKEVPDDALGIQDYTFEDLEVRAKCTPIGKTMAQLLSALAIQGGTARRGQALLGTSDLVLTGAGGSPVITLNKPAIKTAGEKWGDTTLRHGEIGFVAQRTFSSGVPDALFTLA